MTNSQQHVVVLRTMLLDIEHKKSTATRENVLPETMRALKYKSSALSAAIAALEKMANGSGSEK